jgi:hypothetical protein
MAGLREKQGELQVGAGGGHQASRLLLVRFSLSAASKFCLV